MRILSQHNFILLGLRGQAKTKLIRMLTTLLDEYVPFIEGSEIHDNPYRPISQLLPRRDRGAGRRNADRLPDRETSVTSKNSQRRT